MFQSRTLSMSSPPTLPRLTAKAGCLHRPATGIRRQLAAPTQRVSVAAQDTPTTPLLPTCRTAVGWNALWIQSSRSQVKTWRGFGCRHLRATTLELAAVRQRSHNLLHSANAHQCTPLRWPLLSVTQTGASGRLPCDRRCRALFLVLPLFLLLSSASAVQPH